MTEPDTAIILGSSEHFAEPTDSVTTPSEGAELPNSFQIKPSLADCFKSVKVKDIIQSVITDTLTGDYSYPFA